MAFNRERLMITIHKAAMPLHFLATDWDLERETLNVQ